MLKIEKLNQFYGESHTLWDLELDVPQGQCTCVMGRNGVGKTSLLRHMLTNKEGLKIGVIVNDLAAVSGQSTIVNK